MTDLHLEFGHSALLFEQLHVEGGLLTPECGHLLLDAGVLSLLESVMTLHFLLDLEVLVSEGFADLLGLEGQNAFEGLLFGTEDLNFFLMVVEFFSE